MEIESILRVSFFEKVDPRRKQEREDARQISEDHKAMANLSNRAIHREFRHDNFMEHLNMFDQSSKNWK